MADSKYNGTVRHVIEFYGITANIPKSLTAFPGFIYNQKLARISFIVANGTSWEKGIIKKVVYSTDPKVQDFNKAFSAANKSADWSKIKTYDMAVNETAPSNPIAIQNPTPRPTPLPTPKPNPSLDPSDPGGASDDPNKKKEDNNMIWYALGAVGLFFMLNKKGKKRKK